MPSCLHVPLFPISPPPPLDMILWIKQYGIYIAPLSSSCMCVCVLSRTGPVTRNRKRVDIRQDLLFPRWIDYQVRACALWCDRRLLKCCVCTLGRAAITLLSTKGAWWWVFAAEEITDIEMHKEMKGWVRIDCFFFVSFFRIWNIVHSIYYK